MEDGAGFDVGSPVTLHRSSLGSRSEGLGLVDKEW